ncbi:MAG: SDR family oxidoreductase [Proteobacteria bacterium]|nr:SDR family oxidoreductase [Pseudomonadota bacterium]
MSYSQHLFDLHGKTALITGASSGLGERFARTLSDAGARVIVSARSIKKLQALAAELGNAVAIQLDVSRKEAVLEAFAELEKTGEKIDICINNAGFAANTPIFQEDNDGEFESMIQTNLMGVWYVTKSAAIHMKRHDIRGSIINIGSVNGEGVPDKDGAAYSVSKAAVIHLTKTLVGELSPYKIRINCISPGWFKTPMNSPSIEKQIRPFIPLGSIAEPSDLDGIILYLASHNASKYVTGACFTVDGGISWGGKPEQ